MHLIHDKHCVQENGQLHHIIWFYTKGNFLFCVHPKDHPLVMNALSFESNGTAPILCGKIIPINGTFVGKRIYFSTPNKLRKTFQH